MALTFSTPKEYQEYIKKQTSVAKAKATVAAKKKKESK